LIENDVYKRFDERYQRTIANLEKVKKEMRDCFESMESSVQTLERITDGRVKATEEKLDKKIEKFRFQLGLI